MLALNHSQYLQLSRDTSLSAFSNATMTGQFQHSSNVECSKIVRNSTAFKFEFELRHIPIYNQTVNKQSHCRTLLHVTNDNS